MEIKKDMERFKIKKVLKMDIKEIIQEIERLIKKKEYEAALKKCEECLKNENLSKEEVECIEFFRIKACRKKGDLEKAKEIADNNPEYQRIQSQMIKAYTGAAQASRSKSERAIYLERAQRIIKRFPSNYIIQTQAIRVLFMQGKCEEAAEKAKEYIDDKIVKKQIERQFEYLINKIH